MCKKVIFRIPSQVNNNNFCSYECRYKGMIGKPSPNKKNIYNYICICGKKKDPRAQTCRECWSDRLANRQIGINNHMWRGGSSFEPYPSIFNKQLKERIRVRDNFICQGCGIPELECTRRLVVHHIDYNKNNCNENNLISLCVRCHNKSTVRRNEWQKKLQLIP